MHAHITPKNEKDINALIQRLLQAFPAKGKAITIHEDAPFIWLNLYGKFDKEQVKWLDDCNLIDDWSWGVGGMITLRNQRITLDTFPSEWEIKFGRNVAKFDVFPKIGKFLRVNGGDGKTFSSEEELHVHLKALGIPLDGWAQHIVLCERCDAPGAGLGYSHCPGCQEALKEFMRVPIQGWCDEMFGE